MYVTLKVIKPYHVYRTNRLSQGVSAYINNCLICEILDNSSYCDTTIEMVSFRVSINMYDFCILAITRPHSDSIENFSHKMKHVLESENLNDKKVILIGDFNINMANENSDYDMFYNIMISYHLVP